MLVYPRAVKKCYEQELRTFKINSPLRTVHGYLIPFHSLQLNFLPLAGDLYNTPGLAALECGIGHTLRV